MPTCPVCREEYQPGIVTCAECQVALVEKLADDASTSEIVDVYTCYDEQQAAQVSDFLTNQGIEVLVRDMSSTSFPTTVGQTAQHFLAVAAFQKDRAQSAIREAVADSALSSEGVLIT